MKSGIKRRREVSAGGLIWRRQSDGSISVVLVRPAGRRTWVLPKGHLEDGETVAQAATREAREESGLTVGAIEPLGEISYVYSARARNGAALTRIFKRVHFFLMEHEGGDPAAHDSETDEVAWLGLDEALARATHPSEQALIAKARTMLGA
jgi:8-oxo-dGTP pyrophosphatase MutT (NUDIX family)